jgi:hypothetical protein
MAFERDPGCAWARSLVWAGRRSTWISRRSRLDRAGCLPADPVAIETAQQVRLPVSAFKVVLLPGSVLPAGNETYELVDGTGTILTLEGMWRLVQHVISRFVADAPKGVDPEFQYRDHLPGLHKVRLSPELWVGQPSGFNKDTAVVRLDGVVQTFLGALASKSQEITDLDAVLAKIEQFAPRVRARARQDGDGRDLQDLARTYRPGTAP